MSSATRTRAVARRRRDAERRRVLGFAQDGGIGVGGRRKPAQRLRDEGGGAGRRREVARRLRCARCRPRLAIGDRHGERRAAADLAVDADVAAVEVDELAHQSEADAGSLVGAPALAFDAVKALEHAGKISGGNADAGVAHGEAGAAGRVVEPHVDAAFEREFEGVGQQIEHDLFPHVAVDIGRRQLRFAVDAQGDARALANRAEIRREVAGEDAEIGFLEIDLGATGFDAREIEQRVDQTQQAHCVAVRDRHFLEPRAAATRRRGAARLRAAPASASAACGIHG